MAKKLNKQQRELIARLSKLNAKTLSHLSKFTSEFNYQRGYTKNALINAVKSTKDKTFLSSIRDTIDVWELYGGNQSLSQYLDTIYLTAEENIKRFIRIQRAKGWSDEDILTLVETSYDLVLYMESETMMKLEDMEAFSDWAEGEIYGYVF